MGRRAGGGFCHGHAGGVFREAVETNMTALRESASEIGRSYNVSAAMISAVIACTHQRELDPRTINRVHAKITSPLRSRAPKEGALPHRQRNVPSGIRVAGWPVLLRQKS
jgi:hypothetical protein